MSDQLRSISRPSFVVVLALIAFAPAAWFTHLAITYAIVPWSCRIGTDLPLHVVTVLAVIGLIGSGTIAVRRGSDDVGFRDRIRLLMSESSHLPPDRDSLPLVALAFAAYFALVVVMTGLVPIVVDRCG